MQQTENYKLNLIETTDPFSPAPLNENTQKLDTILSTETTALDARVTALEARKIAIGHYVGDGEPSRTFDVGFTPIAVLIHGAELRRVNYGSIAVTGYSPCYGSAPEFSIVENGFTVYKSDYLVYNNSGYEYNYIALG